MIFDPIIEITCDRCGSSEDIQPNYKHTDYSGDHGYYDCEDRAIEKLATDLLDWIIEDGKHYCSEECSVDG